MSSIGNENKKYFEGSKDDSQDVYSVIFLLIWMLKDDPKYSLINDLIYTLDEKNFINFIQVFQGTTIKVPTLDEVELVFKSFLYYQLKYVESRSSYAIRRILEIPHTEEGEEYYKQIISLGLRISKLLKNSGNRQERFEGRLSGINNLITGSTQSIINYNEEQRKRKREESDGSK